MKRRSRWHMMMAILEVTSHGGLKQTHIMYKANINCGVVKTLAEQLIKLGLLKKELPFYKPTAKGHECLRAFRGLMQFFGHDNPWSVEL